MTTCERCGEELVANTFHVCDADVPLLRLRPASTPDHAGSMSRGHGRIVVGYRPGSRRVNYNREAFGLEPSTLRKCMAGCGYPVLFYSGGVDAVHERDAQVICEECKNEHYSELVAGL